MSRTRWSMPVVLALTTSATWADDAPTEQAKSTAARSVLAKREAAATKALAAYRAALNDADKQLVADADAALRRPAVVRDVAASAELTAVKRAAQARLKEANSADPEFPILAATYGNLEKSIDVLAGVRKRLANRDDLWVNSDITDGKARLDGDLRLVLRATGGKPVVLTCRHGSRVLITR